jgi:hypothetical protein
MPFEGYEEDFRVLGIVFSKNGFIQLVTALYVIPIKKSRPRRDFFIEEVNLLPRFPAGC